MGLSDGKIQDQFPNSGICASLPRMRDTLFLNEPLRFYVTFRGKGLI